MNKSLIAALKQVVAEQYQNILTMLESYWSESEPLGDTLEEWIDDNSSFEYWLKHAPYKKWKLENLDPKKLNYHHGDQDTENMEYVREASSPEEIPPIIVNNNLRTVDGAHRLRVAQEDDWEYIKTWHPDTTSRMTDEEIKSFKDLSGTETIELLKSIS